MNRATIRAATCLCAVALAAPARADELATDVPRREWDVKPIAELFASYAFRDVAGVAGSSWFHAFDLGRARLGVEGSWKDARGVVLLEAVRSQAGGGLLGIDGDSLVIRVREAYAGWTPVEGLEADLGVVPTLAIDELDAAGAMRPVAETLLESSGLESPSDLGARVRYTLPRQYGWVAAEATNGEGYAQPERNRGKNLAVAAEIHPVPATDAWPLAVLVEAQDGSQGTARVATDRLTGAVLWDGKRIHAGLTGTLGFGVDGSAGKKAAVVELFARGEPVERVLVLGRYSHWQRDLDVSDDRIDTVLIGAGYQAAKPLAFYGTVARSFAGATATAAQPDASAWTLAVTAHLLF